MHFCKQGRGSSMQRKGPNHFPYRTFCYRVSSSLSPRAIFSQMRSKGSHFTLGVWGLRVCSLDVAFMFATVRNRPREGCMAVPMVSSAKGVTFGGCTCRIASFRVAGVALRDIQTCFVTCRKSFCVAGAMLLRRFQKMRCSFRGRRSTLNVSIVILHGRGSTLDVSCCVFLRMALSGLRQVATRWKFRGRCGILQDVMKIGGCLARNIDFEVANIDVHKKPRRKTSILEATKCTNWRKSGAKCSF